jgi:hypothetical protein
MTDGRLSRITGRGLSRITGRGLSRVINRRVVNDDRTAVRRVPLAGRAMLVTML